MAYLSKQSSGRWHTPEGFAAIVPLHVSAETATSFIFTFKTNMLSEPLSIEWDKETDIAFIENSLADSLISNAWAKELDDKFANELNEKAEKLSAVVDEAAELAKQNEKRDADAQAAKEKADADAQAAKEKADADAQAAKDKQLSEAAAKQVQNKAQLTPPKK